MDAVPGLTDAPSPPQPLRAAGSVTTLAAAAGALPGGGSVTPAGEYTYRIPIEVPPGRAGMAPSLALVHSSRGRNGHLGVGWRIEGLSEISRCPRTFAVDGFSDGVRLDDHDALCLDGRRLVSIGTGKLDGCAGEEWRTEDDTFARVLSCGHGNAVTLFRVYSKDGRIHDYQPIQVPTASAAGAQPPGDNPPGGTVDFAWVLSVDRDRAGNAIHYQYGQTIAPFGGNDPPAVEYYPTEIDYTFQDTTGEAGQRSIHFDYLPAGVQRPDPSFSYVAGVRVNVTQRLAAIEAWAPNPVTPSKVWRYDLTYDTSPGSGASILTKVQRCGALGGCLPAKRFGWASSAGPAYEALAETHSAMTGAPLVLDLDGDGRDDVLYAGLTEEAGVFVLTTADPKKPLAVETSLHQGSVPAWFDPSTARPVDVDGDGTDELVLPGSQPGAYDLVFLDSSLHAPSPSIRMLPWLVEGSGANGQAPAFFADLDGDGLPDLLGGSPQQPGSAYWNWAFALNTGYGDFGPATPVNPGGLAIPPIQVDGVPASFAIDEGRRRATLYFGETQGPLGNGLAGFWLDTHGHPQSAGPAPGGLSAFADLNGDGLHETVTARVDVQNDAVEIGVSGNDWPPYETALDLLTIPWDASTALDPNKFSLLVADLDGDGRDDVIVSYRGTPGSAVRVWLDTSGALAQAPLGAPPPDAVGDFDGDGLLDLLVWAGSPWSTSDEGETSTSWTVYRQTGGGTSDRITSVSDEGGAEAREKVTYATSFSAAPAPAPEPPAATGCEHPQRCMRHGFSVVREHDVYQGDAVDAPPPAYQRRVYDYDDARSDVQGRGFLGFGVVRLWEPDREAETVTYYFLTTRHGSIYPGAGRPKKVRRAVLLPGPGVRARIAQIEYSYGLERTNDERTWFVHPSAWTSFEWEQPVTAAVGAAAEHFTGIDTPSRASALRVRDGKYTYDAYGNVLDAWVHTTDGVTTETVTAYEIRRDDWLVGLVKRRTVTSTSAGKPAATAPRRTDYTYDAQGYLCHAYVDQDDDDPSMIEVLTYAHDGDGQVRAITASAVGLPSRTTHVAYDATERVYAEETWNDLGHAAWSAHDLAYGVVAMTEDANGVSTQYQYDDAGRLVRRAPSGGGARIAYAPRLGGGTTDVLGTSVTVTRDGGAASRTDLDPRGRVVGGGHMGFDGTWIEQARRYDVLGRVVAVTRPGFGAPSDDVTVYAYDDLDRLAQVTTPDQQVTTIASSFYETKTTDPLGHVRSIRRDRDDRPIESAAVTAKGEVRTTYAYGDFDQLETTTDAEGNVVRAQYDRRGRRTRVDDPDTGYRTFTYDGFGDLVMSMVNGGTLTTWYTLDAIGRTLEVHGDTGEITTFAWDTAPNGVGRLAHTTSPDGTAQDLEYDGAGRLSAETWTVDGAPFRFDLHYDPAARLGQIDYPVVAGQPRFSITYDYNAAGALGDVADTTSLAPYWMAEERNEDDRLLLGALGNGVAQTRGYDDTTGRLTTVFDGTPSGSATALSLAYDYDEIGRVRHRTDAQAGRVEAFGYDGLDRLHTWDLAHWIALPGGQSATTTIHATSFGYSDLGNLETVEVDGALVERNKYGGIAGPHALTNNGEGEYVYDDRGRLTQGPGRSVAYTSFDLPRTVTTAAGVTSFEYDAAGARVKKTGPDGATTVTLAGLYERRAVGAKVEHVFYVPGSEGVVAQVSLDEASGASATEYLHLDALGSVGAVTDAGGQVLGRMYYAPFGERRDQDGNAVTSVAGDVPVGFTGQWHDDDLGLVDMKGRVYDPSLRRFLTPDPVVAAPLWGQSFNRYSYVLNDPVNLVDLTGFTAADPSDPNAPDYPQGCGGVWSCNGWSGGVVVDLPGQEGQQSGFSVPKYTTGAPVLGSNRRPVSLPVGPTAPAASILGPPTPAALAVLGPPFGPLLGPGWVTISAPTTADAAAIGFGRWLERSVDHSVSYIVDTWGPSRSIQMLDAMEANATKGYKRDGLLGGIAGAVNTLNPLYGYGVTGAKVAIAAGKGDVAGMVENGMDVLAAVVTLFIGGPEGAPEPGLPEGSFSIIDWTGYPEGLPRPSGPFRLLSEPEYQQARAAANAANRALHQADPATYDGTDIHEIQPVKFGGSPTDVANKVPLPRSQHIPFTAWWNALQRDLEQ
jgi:RHS repeat-associated protein